MTRELSTSEMATLTAGATMWTTPAIPDAGIPSLSMADGPMGVAGSRVDERDISLLTPSPLALGASWDPALVRKVGRLVGGEAIRRGVDLMLAPNLNMARSPLSGRAFEYFSEDPLLCGTLGSAWVDGCQSVGTGAIAKHLVCNDSETERDRMNAVVDERTLREVYLLPFEMAAEAGCAGMLTAYNKINGDWCAEAGPVVKRVVKDEWRFPGVFMSDWFGTHSTVGSLNGGLDLEMPGPARHLGAKSAAVVAEGQVAQERLHDAAQRVATAARRFGAAKGEPLPDDVAAELLIEAAASGFTLVRNEPAAPRAIATGAPQQGAAQTAPRGTAIWQASPQFGAASAPAAPHGAVSGQAILPLDPVRWPRIVVIGPNATAPCFQGGTFAKIAVKPDAVLPLDALRARFGDAIVAYAPGVDPQPKLPRMAARPRRDLGDGCVKGMTLDYFDNADLSGRPLFSETRDTNSLTWFHGVHEAGASQTNAGTRASGWFRASESGEHQFYVGGTGALRLLVDGKEYFRRDEQLAPGDVMGRLKSGDADCIAITLEKDKAVEVVVELRYTPARCQGLWYGIRAPGSAGQMMAAAVQAARQADAVILMVGETSDASVESKDRADTLLPPEQIDLIERICAANANTVIVTNVGHAFDVCWEQQARAVLHCWYPGQEFGNALAQVLAGDREPGGRMPVTIARQDSDYPALSLQPDANGDLHYSDGVRFGYRGLAAKGIEARQPFGAGFGYASFTLSDARVCRAAAAAPTTAAPADAMDHATVAHGDALGDGGGWEVTVKLRNTSNRAGAEVVQVYRTVPELTLVGYAKVWLEPGQEQEVRIAIAPRRLQVWDGGWTALRGDIDLLVGRSSADLPLSLQIKQ